MAKKKQAKRKPGRPPKQKVFTVEELREQSKAGRIASAKHRQNYNDLDVDEFVSDIDRLTRKRKLTEQEILDLRTKVDLLYHEYVEQQQIEEAELTEPYVDPLRALALEGEASSTKQMSKEEWNREHGLRKDGKGRKPGPKKQKPKSIFDVQPQQEQPELPDFEQLEQQWMEQQLQRRADEPRFSVGKRLRDDITLAMHRRRTKT